MRYTCVPELSVTLPATQAGCVNHNETHCDGLTQTHRG
jgi:hypothetical protein